jgi:PAS domain S-box-containing protein
MAEFHLGNGQLHDSESPWRHMPAMAPTMLWLTDATGNCTFRSQHWQAYTGQSATTALGEGWLEVVHPDDRAAVRETCRASHAPPAVFHRDFRLRRADGVYRWTMDTGHPRWADSGAFLGYIGVLINIDDRKQAMEMQTDDNAAYRTVWPDGSPLWIRACRHPLYETPNQLACLVGVTLDIPPQKLAEAVQQRAHNALEQRVAELTAALQHEMAERQRLERKAQRAQHFSFLGRLAAEVSHEIRNPLGTIALSVDFLEEELHQLTSDSPAAMAESLTEIKTQVGRLTELMEDCLSMVRTSSIELTSQSLAALVTSWSAEIEKQAMACGVTIHLEGLATLEPVAVHANTLRRAVLNLLQNAVDAMSQGGLSQKAVFANNFS